jgi:hypothetical protein
MKKQDSKEINYLQEKFSNDSLTHWIEQNGVRFHIFTIQSKTIEQLDINWESLTDMIAGYYQADIEDEYETWNFYIVFLSEFEIPKNLKYKIENDKYSSRKIVLDNMLPPIDDKKITDEISKKIFLFDADIEQQRDALQRDLAEIVDKDLYSLINKKNLEGLGKVAKEEKKRVFENILRNIPNEI